MVTRHLMMTNQKWREPLTNLTDALSDLKSEIAVGTDPDLAIETVAQEYGLRPVFLKNRAVAALGDLSTWAERDRAAREALAPSLAAAKQKMVRTRIEDRIRAHNAGTARVSEDELQKLIVAANALGGNWVAKKGRQRSASDEFDVTIRKLLRLLKQANTDEKMVQLLDSLMPGMK